MKTQSALLLALLFGFTGYAQQPVISIETDKPGAAINKDFYGIFFEDINHAVEGGLYAEMLQNRDFEGNRLPEGMRVENNTVISDRGWKAAYKLPAPLAGWSSKKTGDALGTIKQVSTMPLNTSNPQNMEVIVSKLGTGKFTVYNEGFWGVSVTKGAQYELNFYARGNSKFKGEIEVSLESALGKSYASQKVTGIGEGWKKYTYTLTALETDQKARFAINILSPGTVWFDVVSLFPKDTYKGRPGGLRKDIAEKIAAVNPGFLRFPGGCIAEGADLDNRIIWKNTIGDIAERPGHWNLWGYHSTDGVGFHDYLQMCEDMSAEAMYVFPVGMSCQFRRCEYVPVDSLQFYVNEVMDALEYAMGPVVSKWGAIRAQNGHPAPFKIKYVEVGNENYGDIYQERYKTFYDAVKGKYPDIIAIACTDPSMRDHFKLSDLSGMNAPIDMIDEHFYESPDFFFKSTDRYDTYDRKGPQIYVGEFAVKKWDNTQKGDLEGALAESAFYTGLERNADIVKLASLAPTLVNENDRTWNPDLIAFNNTKSYGIPSYHAIKMFKNNLADNVLPTTINFNSPAPKADEKGMGILGFTNPSADCIYQDIKVTIDGKTFEGAALFTAETLSKFKGGIFKVGKNVSVNTLFRPDVIQFGEAHNWKNYNVSLRAYANVIDDLEGFKIIFWSTGKDKHWNWDIGRWRRMSWLEWYDKGYESYFGESRGNIDEKRWYDVSITVSADSVNTFLDGKPVHSVKKPQLVTPGMYVTAGEKANGNEIIVKVVNATPIAQNTSINLNGSKKLMPEGQAVILTSASKYDGNSMDEPEKVSPKTVTVTGVSSKFNYNFLPNSVTILKLKQQ